MYVAERWNEIERFVVELRLAVHHKRQVCLTLTSKSLCSASPHRLLLWALFFARMASTASMPPYMLPGVLVHHPSHLEGDPSLATEILPGPPSLVAAQQSVLKRDPRKPSNVFSYLPPSDPGSTYSGIMHGTLIGHEHEGARLKRSK
jgi:hypothetical protein